MLSKGYKYEISRVNDGNLSFVWGEYDEVLANRKKFLARAGFDFDKCVTVKTSDSSEVRVVDRQDAGRGILHLEEAFAADALMTTSLDINLFLLVADCAPTILYDPTNRVLCLAHLNSMNLGLIPAVMTKFTEKYSTNLSELKVFIGPAIHQGSFIVPDPFQRQESKWQNYIVNLDEHLTAIDMVGYLRDEMVRNGVSRKNITVSDVDTYKDMDYYSHRRSAVTGEREGRFAMVVKLTE